MDTIICKCGATTYEQHLVSGQPAHTFKQDKSNSQVRQGSGNDKSSK
ncbi:hypothetical protein ACWC4D_33800 [Streptomyces sp. NPDC001288]